MIDPFDPGPQPGGRAAAPGELGLVQAFVNSNYDLVEVHGAELLSSGSALAGWLSERGLVGRGARSSDADLRRAITLREGLRVLLLANNGIEPAPGALDGLQALAPQLLVGVRFGLGGPELVPAGEGVDGALGAIAAIAARAMLAGEWGRLKACRDPHCHWAFYDRSRNLASEWCSMRVCGGRAKARRHYVRSRNIMDRVVPATRARHSAQA
jgi:predicted RNA-binding Zn ribbon-like protein